MFQKLKLKFAYDCPYCEFTIAEIRVFNAHVQVEHTLEAVKVGVTCMFLICFSNSFIFCSSERHLCQKPRIIQRIKLLCNSSVDKASEAIIKGDLRKPQVNLFFSALFVDPS